MRIPTNIMYLKKVSGGLEATIYIEILSKQDYAFMNRNKSYEKYVKDRMKLHIGECVINQR